ncbi:hypothetical protein BH20ACI2_BH20ACI2_02290 [soil metagenome]
MRLSRSQIVGALIVLLILLIFALGRMYLTLSAAHYLAVSNIIPIQRSAI